MRCNKGNTLIHVKKVLVNDVMVNSTVFPELDKDVLTAKCFTENVEEIIKGFKVF